MYALIKNPRDNEVTLILFSASPKDLIDFDECGADGVIEKPFDIKDLVEKINGAIKKRTRIIKSF